MALPPSSALPALTVPYRFPIALLALRLLSAVSSQPNGIYVRFCVVIEFVLSRH
jgi:hypothetical protein